MRRTDTAAQPTTTDVFAVTLADLAQAHGITVNRVIRTRRGKGASAGRGIVRYGRQMASRPHDFQRWCAAHELAHLSPAPELAPKPAHALLIVLYASAAAGIAGVLLVGAAMWVTSSPTMLDLGAILVVAAGVLLAIATVLNCRECRTNETQVDHLASKWGYPLTPAIADQIRAEEPAMTRWHICRPLRKHPLPEDRITSQVI